MQQETLPRGCGYRKVGGIYAECSLSSHGREIEDFLLDPPRVVDEQALGLSSIGVKLIELDGVWHLFDIVGQEHYPNVADYIEEVRRMGASRRLARTLDYAKTTPDTKLVLLHRRAHIANSDAYYAALGNWPPPGWRCPRHRDVHAPPEHAPTEMCAGLWWRDIVKGVPTGQSVNGLTPVERAMPAFRYAAWARPPDLEPLHELAVFMILPLTRIAVVRGAHDEHERSLRVAQASHLPVELVEN